MSWLAHRCHFPARFTSLVSAFIVIVASHFRRLITSLITLWTVAMSDGLPRPFLCPSALRAVRRARINLRASCCTSVARKISVAVWNESPNAMLSSWKAGWDGRRNVNPRPRGLRKPGTLFVKCASPGNSTRGTADSHWYGRYKLVTIGAQFDQTVRSAGWSFPNRTNSTVGKRPNSLGAV